MTATARKLAETVVLLPAKERAYIAERLLASLEDADLDEQWAAEARRRHNQIRSGKVKPVPAEEVYRRIDQLLNK